jgi:hypothetical protein
MRMTKGISLRMLAISAGVLFAAGPAWAEGPFNGLAGRWVGGGKIVYTGGKSESLSCKVTYVVGGGGASVQQSIRCAGASSSFVVKTSMAASGNKLSGSWSETIHNVNGSASGRVSGNTVSVSIAGDGFSGSMSVNTNGSSQSVSIKPSGKLVDQIALSLRKG